MANETIANIIRTSYDLAPLTHLQEVFLGIANRSFVLETEKKKYFLQFNRLDGELLITLENFQYKADLLTWLKQKGITQVIAPVPARDGALCIQPASDGITYTLYEFRAQKLMYSEDPALNRKMATSLTETIARLHTLTGAPPHLVGPARMTALQYLGWMQQQRATFQQFQHALTNFEWPAPIEETVARSFAQLDTCYRLIYEAQNPFQLIQDLQDTQCLVHDDLNPTNLSFTPDGELETLYDFDNAHWDVRAADLMYLYFYHYYSSPYPGQDTFNSDLAEEMLALYEKSTHSQIRPQERQLFNRLLLANILRGFLWLTGNLLRGTPLPVIAHGASRLRPQPGLPPAASPAEAVARTFSITLHALETFATLVAEER